MFVENVTWVISTEEMVRLSRGLRFFLSTSMAFLSQKFVSFYLSLFFKSTIYFPLIYRKISSNEETACSNGGNFEKLQSTAFDMTKGERSDVCFIFLKMFTPTFNKIEQ